MKKRPWTMGEVRKMIELYQQGLCQREISRMMNRPVCSIQKYLIKYYNYTPRIYWNHSIKNKLMKLVESGLTQTEIARKLDVTQSTVCKWVKKLSIKEKMLVKDGRKNPAPKPREMRRKLAIVRCDQIRDKCKELGWPQVNSTTQARILQAISQGAHDVYTISKMLNKRDRRDRLVRLHLEKLELLGMIIKTSRMGPKGNTYTLAHHMLIHATDDME